MPNPAIILLSGGLDSATCLAIARAQGFAPLYTMAFDYGQRHRHELKAAAELATRFATVHKVITLDLRQFGHSALTDDIAVPKHEDVSEIGLDGSIPVTYVPARNTLFLSYALAWAEVLGVVDLFIGVNALDYSGYPDCRPEFIASFEATANLATAMTAPGAQHRDDNRKRLTIHTPLIKLTKGQIIRRGHMLGLDYALTHSCYDPLTTPGGVRACGHCDSCLLRKKGFAEAAIPDPTPYA